MISETRDTRFLSPSPITNPITTNLISTAQLQFFAIVNKSSTYLFQQLWNLKMLLLYFKFTSLNFYFKYIHLQYSTSLPGPTLLFHIPFLSAIANISAGSLQLTSYQELTQYSLVIFTKEMTLISTAFHSNSKVNAIICNKPINSGNRLDQNFSESGLIYIFVII